MQALTAHHTTARQGSDACRRLDARIRGADPRLYSAFNLATSRYEIWRDCPDGNQALILIVQDARGGFVHPDHCDIRINQQLHSMDMAQPGRSAERVIQEVQDHNAAVDRQRWEQAKGEMVAVGEYARPWIAQADAGQPRYPAEDVLSGLHGAMGPQGEN